MRDAILWRLRAQECARSDCDTKYEWISDIKEKQIMDYVQGKLDRLVEKAISRKFMVWLTATGLFAFYNLESSDWVMISAIYIGGQAVIDGIARMKGM